MITEEKKCSKCGKKIKNNSDTCEPFECFDIIINFKNKE